MDKFREIAQGIRDDALNHYDKNTQHYAHHDAEAADRNEQKLRDAIIRQLEVIFVKLITQEKMATKATFKERLKDNMQEHLSYILEIKEMNPALNESFVS